MITFRFYATGSFLITIGDFAGVSKLTVSKVILEISKIIAGYNNEFIYMPRTSEERNQMYSEFYKIAYFPTVIGTVDCTHIRVQSPGKTFRCILLYILISKNLIYLRY
jgi:hypothetical protein